MTTPLERQLAAALGKAVERCGALVSWKDTHGWNSGFCHEQFNNDKYPACRRALKLKEKVGKI